MTRIFALVLLILMAALPARAADKPEDKSKSGNKVESSVDKAGAAMGKTADKVEKSVKKGANKTEKAINSAGNKTSKWLHDKTD